MVAVAQLVESRIVIPVVVGSSPISHPSIISLTEMWGFFTSVGTFWGLNMSPIDEICKMTLDLQNGLILIWNDKTTPI